MALHLRLHRRLAGWLLAGYLLVLGVSALAAALSPKTLEVVCSSMGVMKVVIAGDEGSPELRTSMDLRAARPCA